MSNTNTQQPAVASTNVSTNNNAGNNISSGIYGFGSSSNSSAGIYASGSSNGIGVYNGNGNYGGLTAGSLNIIGGPYSGSSGQYTWSNPTPINFGNDKYSILKLPGEVLPEAVFVSGRMITFGAFGSDAECVFVGDALIFAPQVLTAITFNNKITIILQYANKMFHYSVAHVYGVIAYKPDSRILDVMLLSETQRGQTV